MRLIRPAAYALTAAVGLAALPGCGAGSPTGAPKAPQSVEKEVKGGKGKVATDELPPPPVRQ